MNESFDENPTLLWKNENFRFIFDKKTKILYKNYYGKIGIQDIVYSWDYAINNNIIPKYTVGFILDYRKAKFDIAISKCAMISDYYKNHLDIFYKRKIAIITENPKDIVVPYLVQKKDEGYLSNPFSTIEGAVEWILLDVFHY